MVSERKRKQAEKLTYFVETSEDYCLSIQDTLQEHFNYRPSRHCRYIHDLKTNRAPQFLWTTRPKDVNIENLPSETVFNHFEGIEALTTKSGLASLLHESKYFSLDERELAPWSYNLGNPSEYRDFIDQFRLLAAINILKVMSLI